MAPDDEPEPRVRRLHAWASSGVGGRECGVWCETCGWELRDVGDSTRRNAAATAHQRPPITGDAK